MADQFVISAEIDQENNPRREWARTRAWVILNGYFQSVDPSAPETSFYANSVHLRHPMRFAIEINKDGSEVFILDRGFYADDAILLRSVGEAITVGIYSGRESDITQEIADIDRALLIYEALIASSKSDPAP